MSYKDYSWRYNSKENAWLRGLGDMGPTLAVQTVLDVALERLTGIPLESFSAVDARYVAQAMIFPKEPLTNCRF